MTTDPTPSTVTASVSEPMLIPERPTLYAVLHPEGGEGKSWAIDSMWTTQDRGELRQSRVPGSVIVTIPGSAEQASKAEPKDGSAKVEQVIYDMCRIIVNPNADKDDRVSAFFTLEEAMRPWIKKPTPSQVTSAQPAPTPKAEPKAHQSVDITDMILKPADEGKDIVAKNLAEDVARCGGPITHDEAMQIARRFIDGHFKNAGKERPRASIPADYSRDDDIRITVYIEQQRANTDTIARLTRERDEWKAKYESTGL